jgi:hypothetical protein
MAGRPKKELDKGLIKQLAGIMCTNDEIAQICGVTRKTLSVNYKDTLDEGRSEAKASLRRQQWQKAMDGNTTMLIWLGKQYLSQRDQPESDINIGPLPWQD